VGLETFHISQLQVGVVGLWAGSIYVSFIGIFTHLQSTGFFARSISHMENPVYGRFVHRFVSILANWTGGKHVRIFTSQLGISGHAKNHTSTDGCINDIASTQFTTPRTDKVRQKYIEVPL